MSGANSAVDSKVKIMTGQAFSRSRIGYPVGR